MKCPNCGREVSEGQSYCNACGGVLYGPRNVNLKNPGKMAGSDQSNDISSITGIDINSLSKDIGIDDYYSAPVEEKPKKKKRKTFSDDDDDRKKKKGLNASTYIFIVVIIVFCAISVALFIKNSKLNKELKKAGTTSGEVQKCEPTKCECRNTEISSCVKGFYALAGYYSFQSPNTWRYSEVSGGVAITNDVDSILLFDYIDNKLSNMSKDKIITEYYSEGIQTAKLTEGKIGSRNGIFVTYFASNIHFTDFYLDDDIGIIYGQVSSPNEGTIESKEIKDILSSIMVLDNKNSIRIVKSTVNYEKIFNNAKTNKVS